MRLKKKALDEMIAENTQWLLDSNIDLAVAENEEDFEQAAFIRDAISNFIQILAELINTLNNKPIDHIIEVLTEQSHFMLQLIKERQENIDNL